MFDSPVWHWLLRVAFAVFVLKALVWRHRAKKGLILGLLLKHGEMTGMQLRNAGVGGVVYSYLARLEEEGLIVRRSLGANVFDGHEVFYCVKVAR